VPVYTTSVFDAVRPAAADRPISRSPDLPILLDPAGQAETAAHSAQRDSRRLARQMPKMPIRQRA
jgi:hypothetical protein